MKPKTRNIFGKILLGTISLPLIMSLLISCDIFGDILGDNKDPTTLVVPNASFKAAIKGSALVDGKINFGGKLTVQITDNKLAGNPISYQWTRDGNPISNATKEEYTILKTDEDKTIGINVTIKGETVAATGIAIPKRAITIAIGGSAFDTKGIVGKEGALSAEVTKNWVAEDKDGNDLPVTYQWVRDSTNISGATKENYSLTAEDSGKTLTCKATYDSKSGTSEGIKIPTTATQTKTLEIKILLENETPKLDECLTADVIKNFSGKNTYQWRRNGEVISWATESSYWLEPADWGKAITVKVTCGDISKESPPVTMQSPLTYEVLIEPGYYGDCLEAYVYISINEDYTYSYEANKDNGFIIQWTRDGNPISGATDSEYTPQMADTGKKIKAIVSGGGQQNVPSNEIEMPPASLLGSWIADFDYIFEGSHCEGTSTLNFPSSNLIMWQMKVEIMTEGEVFDDDWLGVYTVNGGNFVLYKKSYWEWSRFYEGEIGDNRIVLLNFGPYGEDLVFTRQQRDNA